MTKEFEKKKQPPLPSVTESGNDEELIRTRAHALYIERGMEDGHEVEDWLRAEQEVSAGNKSSIAA
jgi:hypothetical protein